MESQNEEKMKFITLNNGVKIPILDYVSYQFNLSKQGGRGCSHQNSIKWWAKVWELFITTKIWTKDMSEDKAKVAFETSLKKLQIDYADLYLIHWAIGNTYGAWWVIYINKTSSKQSGWATFIPQD